MLILLAGAALLMAEPAPAAQPAPAAEAAKAEKPKKPKLVCTTERPMGSQIPKRVCRTSEQVQAEIDAARRQGLVNSDAQCRSGGC